VSIRNQDEWRLLCVDQSMLDTACNRVFLDVFSECSLNEIFFVSMNDSQGFVIEDGFGTLNRRDQRIAASGLTGGLAKSPYDDVECSRKNSGFIYGQIDQAALVSVREEAEMFVMTRSTPKQAEVLAHYQDIVAEYDVRANQTCERA
jgi:hypothetical protein